ncbi:MAG: quinone-dependent dihydroorotate dehydrogenase [Deltaproteobacteria bacterium]|nr:quinone-dependent dihydroorotate dehydrogenase [Deltaproteobacteria bacterium]
MYSLLKKFLFSLEPETAHGLVKNLGCVAPKFFFRATTSVRDSRLNGRIGSVTVDNPIGLAAGFDKNGEMIPLMRALGFGFLELGSVTLNPCLGNSKPRLFRLPADESLINRLGLPNAGADHFLKNVKKKQWGIPLGINIAKTPFVSHAGTPPAQTRKAVEEYVRTFTRIGHLGAYVVLNLSCPNTGDGKTFEDPKAFSLLARGIAEARRDTGNGRPVLVKISPDTEKKELKGLIEEAEKWGFDGYVVGNSTAKRPHLYASHQTLKKIGPGGLTGRALAGLANHQLKNVREIAGPGTLIIGVGGILSFKDLVAKLSLGAAFFQVYTGLVYRGPWFVKSLNRDLAALCARHGVKNYLELRGLKEIVSGL